MTSLTKE